MAITIVNAAEIQNGDNTHHQDQLMILMSLRITKTIVVTKVIDNVDSVVSFIVF